jgi:dienelactone hydrolase
MNARFLYRSQGYPFNALEARPVKATNKWLLMFFGTGELGPADAREISDLDNAGYQKNLGFETEFNILAPQATREKGYAEFEHTVLPWMISTYGTDIEIFITGHSLGGRQVMEYVNKYRGLEIVKQVVGFMPIAGEMSGPYPEDPCTCVDLPVMAVHGGLDTTINKVQSEKFANLLNKCVSRQNKAILDIVPGANHGSVLNTVFQYDKNSKYYQFIMSCFTDPSEESIECSATYYPESMRVTLYLFEGNKTYKLIP